MHHVLLENYYRWMAEKYQNLDGEVLKLKIFYEKQMNF